MDVLISGQEHQGNSHIYFEDNASIYSYNSDPNDIFSNLDDWRTCGLDDAMSCGEEQHFDEWITVAKKHKQHNRRGKARSYTVARSPITRIQSRLMQKFSSEVRLPKTAVSLIHED